MVSIFSPFFWSTKVMETQSALAKDGSGSSCRSSCMAPSVELLKNRTPAQFIIFVFRFPSSLFVEEYSQERMAKKRAPARSAPCACLRGFELSSYICFQTWSGRQAWWDVAGSASLYDFNCLTRMAPFAPEGSRVGSGRKFCLKV